MKAPKKTKAQWLRQQREAMKALSAIEVAERAKLAERVIGKCFRYSNSYGHGSQWWLYGRVIGTDEYGWFRMFQFEATDNGEMQIRTEHQRTHLNGWDPIAANIFQEEWDAFRNRINTIAESAQPAR
jgi:hypothetical protein